MKIEVTINVQDPALSSKINKLLETVQKGFQQMALGQKELADAVAAVEGDVEKVVNAVAQARTDIATLTQQVADLVAAGDTTAIVDRLTAIDTALDAAVPDTAPTP